MEFSLFLSIERDKKRHGYARVDKAMYMPQQAETLNPSKRPFEMQKQRNEEKGKSKGKKKETETKNKERGEK